MLVIVHWSPVLGEEDPKWVWSMVLYVYLHPQTKEVLYIGKATKQTVRERSHWSGKKEFWEDLQAELGSTKVIVLVGDISLPEGSRLTDQLISDIESLLIKRIQPWGNVQSKSLRISRPSMRVRCTGEWPFGEREYRDVGFS